MRKNSLTGSAACRLMLPAVVGLMMLVAVACTDKWDDHFAEDASLSSSLWTALQTNADLSNFCSVLEATGYDARLKSSQMFTVFAPVNALFPPSEAQRIIQLYRDEQQRGTRDADNQAVRQFVQNHIALFNHSVSGLSHDSVTMMNGKYQVLSDERFGQSPIVSRNQFCTNGVLYTIETPEPYFANVLEYLSQDGQTDSIYHFLSSYSRYEFDAEQSVAGDIVKGKTVYLDSVFRLTNPLLREYGYINREDSSYMAVVPTDDVWKTLFDEYIGYFNYNSLTSKRDSMVLTHTRRAIADGTIFNLNVQSSAADSVVSTAYERLYRNQPNYADRRYYVYYQPYAEGGALSNAETAECSNGRVLKKRTWDIDKRETFFQQIKVEAEQTRYVDTIIQAREPLSQRVVPMANPFYGKISGNSFVEAQPLSTASSTSVRYAIPDQLSNIGYDIYAVFVPAIAYDEHASADDRLPCRVRFTLTYCDQEGNVQQVSLRNPTDNAVNFETRPDVVDSVLVASNFRFPTCALDLTDPQVTLRVASNITSSMSARFTRTLRLDCILLRPSVHAQ